MNWKSDHTYLFTPTLLVAHTVQDHNGIDHIRIISARQAQKKKRGNNMSKIVTYKVNLNNVPVLSDEQKARLDALAKRPGSEIDFSDVAELDESFWKNAVQNPLYKPTKQVTTIRIDADVMQWLKSQGKGYQTRMNKILREAMLKELKNHP